VSAASLRESAAQLLGRWRPAGRDAVSVRESMLAFVGSTPLACSRTNVSGHITASAVVFSHDDSQVLLTLHPRVGKWIQLGGHCEPDDATVVDAALREATEESGIAALRIEPTLFGAVAHPISCSLGVPTRHLDLQFRVRAPEGAVPVRSSESIDLRWWPVGALPADADVLLRPM
jgi:8-oxo-dGTP pyrophosphatase MutT (NUDIX family)